jgi:hypothetical protein
MPSFERRSTIVSRIIVRSSTKFKKKEKEKEKEKKRGELDRFNFTISSTKVRLFHVPMNLLIGLVENWIALLVTDWFLISTREFGSLCVRLAAGMCDCLSVRNIYI